VEIRNVLNFEKVGLLALLCVLHACSSAPKPYERGTTDYSAGKATVTQPDITQRPLRSFDGIRVAGPDTDLVTDYWDVLLTQSRAAGNGPQSVFQTFRSRHHDLEVYQTAAADPALREFRRWARHNGILQQFDEFWAP
jgi:hypothetical protein